MFVGVQRTGWVKRFLFSSLVLADMALVLPVVTEMLFLRPAV